MSMSASRTHACARCQSPIEPEDLRCAVCSLPVTREASAAAGTQAVIQILRCEGCGAALTYDVEARAPTCAFCGAVAHLETSEDPIEEADLYLPFLVQPDTAQAALRQWLGTLGFFRPSDLQSQATVAALRPLWWVGWSFDVEALVSWTADSNHDAGRARWAPHAGQSRLTLRNVLISASRGLTEEEVSKLAPGFELDTARRSPHAMAGATIERFDVQRSAARRIIAQAVEAEARQRAGGWVPGSRLRNLRVAVLPQRLLTRRYGLPTYVLAYRYRGELYRAVVHGQDTSYVFGSAPYSLPRILLVIGLALLAVGGLLALLAARAGS